MAEEIAILSSNENVPLSLYIERNNALFQSQIRGFVTTRVLWALMAQREA